MSTKKQPVEETLDLKAIIRAQQPLFVRAAGFTFINGVLLLAPTSFCWCSRLKHSVPRDTP